MLFSLHKITPVAVVCIAAVVFIVIVLIRGHLDYGAAAYLVVYLILVIVAFAIDRVLVSKISYGKLFVSELLVLVLSATAYIYFNRYDKINIETSEPYFFVHYDRYGIKESDILFKGFWFRSTTFTVGREVHIHSSLEGKVRIVPPPDWEKNYSFDRDDLITDDGRTGIELYSKKMEYLKLHQLLQDEILKLKKGALLN